MPFASSTGSAGWWAYPISCDAAGRQTRLRVRRRGYRAAMMLFPYTSYKMWCGHMHPKKMQKQFAKNVLALERRA